LNLMSDQITNPKPYHSNPSSSGDFEGAAKSGQS